MLNRSTYVYLGFLLTIGFTYGAYKFNSPNASQVKIGTTDYNERLSTDPNLQKLLNESHTEVTAIETRLAKINVEKSDLELRKNNIQTFLDQTKSMMQVIDDLSALPKSKEGRERVLKLAAAILKSTKEQKESKPLAKITSDAGMMVLRFDAERLFRPETNRDQLRASKIRKFEGLMSQIGSDVTVDKITIFQASEDLNNLTKSRLRRLKEYFINEFNGKVDNFEVKAASRDQLPEGTHFVFDIAISEKTKAPNLKSKNIQSKPESKAIAASTDTI